MAGDVDGFVVPVPTGQLDACRRMARRAGRHGWNTARRTTVVPSA